MKHLFSAILDFIFPRHCCTCGQYLSYSNYRYVCDRCFNNIIFQSTNLCSKCGYDFGETNLPNPKLCPVCCKKEFYFKSLRSAVRLNDTTKQLIHRFKYWDGEYLVHDLCKITQKNSDFIAFLADSTIVPVPLHWRRQFFREYNQSELLAKTLAKLPIHIKVLPLLKRIRYTRPQVELPAFDRQNNMKHAFCVNSKIKVPFENKLIVFDDVFTTGSTINECCKTLQKHGFSNIYAATFAQASRD